MFSVDLQNVSRTNGKIFHISKTCKNVSGSTENVSCMKENLFMLLIHNIFPGKGNISCSEGKYFMYKNTFATVQGSQQ
jgi:hypothetical protein